MDDGPLTAPCKFAFVSRETRKHFGHKVPPHRGAVVDDGVGIDKAAAAGGEVRSSVRHEFNITDDAKAVVTSARVSPQKDYATLAGAASPVVKNHPKRRFLVVGDNSQAGAYREH